MSTTDGLRNWVRLTGGGRFLAAFLAFLLGVATPIGITTADEGYYDPATGEYYSYDDGSGYVPPDDGAGSGDPYSTDADEDGLTLAQEEYEGHTIYRQTFYYDEYGTDWHDGAPGYWTSEIVTVYTSDSSEDSDGDGLPDPFELNYVDVLDPSDPDDGAIDHDNDLLSSAYEYLIGTSILDPDSDFDGYLLDGDEVLIYQTDPLDANDPADPANPVSSAGGDANNNDNSSTTDAPSTDGTASDDSGESSHGHGDGPGGSAGSIPQFGAPTTPKPHEGATWHLEYRGGGVEWWAGYDETGGGAELVFLGHDEYGEEIWEWQGGETQEEWGWQADHFKGLENFASHDSEWFSETENPSAVDDARQWCVDRWPQFSQESIRGDWTRAVLPFAWAESIYGAGGSAEMKEVKLVLDAAPADEDVVHTFLKVTRVMAWDSSHYYEIASAVQTVELRVHVGETETRDSETVFLYPGSADPRANHPEMPESASVPSLSEFPEDGANYRFEVYLIPAFEIEHVEKERAIDGTELATVIQPGSGILLRDEIANLHIRFPIIDGHDTQFKIDLEDGDIRTETLEDRGEEQMYDFGTIENDQVSPLTANADGTNIDGPYDVTFLNQNGGHETLKIVVNKEGTFRIRLSREDNSINIVSQKFTVEKRIRKYARVPEMQDVDFDGLDNAFVAAAEYWGAFYQHPIDPDVLKAVGYQESTLGFGDDPTDIMTVGNPGDNVLNILRKENGRQEVEAIPNGTNGWTIRYLDYDDADEGPDAATAIHWGTCWLYHKAQKGQLINDSDNPPHYVTLSGWNTWEDAVGFYGPGTPYRGVIEGPWKRGRKDSTTDRNAANQVYERMLADEDVIYLWPILTNQRTRK